MSLYIYKCRSTFINVASHLFKCRPTLINLVLFVVMAQTAPHIYTCISAQCDISFYAMHAKNSRKCYSIVANEGEFHIGGFVLLKLIEV